ncbi:Por secretion system C-terminal sorting domain-containing protein [Catalinimonas alkaloidigena]|uniref:Por secretion system C-terminal sorting domain-containing protein n=1 Tax=Catalinimonas alkaloidigena TaxID=1075417 RepID=A0A1G9LDA8_9BACT|nr:DUF4397 domain-containing protein [Catalinimonas alkaloidigena]SDL59525.1 Por secretion system C-terminal sorting domain-containing protein [Catalinimonas alkaloidigena]
MKRLSSLTLITLLFLGSLGLTSAVHAQARVQIIHNAADADAAMVDIYVNDGILYDDVAFRTATPFFDAPAGTAFDVSVQPMNSTDTVGALFKQTYTLEDGETYVIVANGILPGNFDNYSADSAFNLYVYPMGQEIVTDANAVDVLVFHGATDAPAVEVSAEGVETPLIDEIAYGEFAGYLSLPTGTYTLTVSTADGTTQVAQYTAPLEGIFAGQAATVLASGFLDPSMNSDGAAFGLYVAPATGGELIALPVATAADDFMTRVSDLRVYPTPAVSGTLYVEYSLREAGPVTLNLLTLQGQKISSQHLGVQRADQGQRIAYSTQGLAPGMYMLQFQTGQTQRAYRVVIQ